MSKHLLAGFTRHIAKLHTLAAAIAPWQSHPPSLLHIPWPTKAAILNMQKPRHRRSLPAVLMRAGTSKGLFIHRDALPQQQCDWTSPILAAMGSQDSDPRQIDGVGGATSTTSKVAVVSPSMRENVDVEYTFIQVAVGSGTVDLSGNCGNMASGVGPFALQEGLVKPKGKQKTMDIRIFNTNTSRHLVETLELDGDSSFKEDGDFSMPGARTLGSEVKVAFVDPAGSMTRTLFPTGNCVDTIFVNLPQLHGDPFTVRATLLDVANPFVWVDSSSLPSFMAATSPSSPAYLETIEAIRRAGAVIMGLAESTEEAGLIRGTPKIAILSPPAINEESKRSDIQVQSFSMGKPHPGLQLTGAVCLAAAVCLKGTVAHRLSQSLATALLPTPERTPSPQAVDVNMFNSSSIKDSTEQKMVQIAHGSGTIDVEAVVKHSALGTVVDRCVVSRTARRLFKGEVYYYC